MNSTIRLRTKIARIAACVALLNLAVPGGALVTFGAPVRERIEEILARRALQQKELSARQAKNASRFLTAQEEKSFEGKSAENPYLAGQNKWDVVYKGVNLMTGNYSTSATDMSFDGGYGIPVNFTRSYSANCADEGPFGKGWTLSADVRSTAGGLVKSSAAPVRSVPTLLKERSSIESDPNVAVQPVAAVTAVDAGGTEETVQKDVDGILTTPAWDKNTYDSVYEWVTLGSQTFQVLVSNTVKTPEGTIYTYAKKGSYPSGTIPWNSTGATAEAANVLKVTSATDRHGNVTTYTYGTNFLAFQKSNGVTSENPLNTVTMPGGHIITLTWGTSGAATGRVTSISDNSGTRTVTYTYMGTAGHGLLASITTPGGKTTQYGYGSAHNYYSNSGPVASDLLTSITSPQGLTMAITYDTTYSIVLPNRVSVLAPCVVKLAAPNGVTDWFIYPAEQPAPGAPLMVDDFWQDSAVACVDASGNIVHYLWAIGNSNRGHSSDPSAIRVTTEFLPNYYKKRTPGPSSTVRTYDIASQNLIDEVQGRTAGFGYGTITSRALADTSPYLGETTETATSYNFLGQPLSKTVTERGDSTVLRTAKTEYAYWGADKYYQQKATRDQAGRYSYTDYYLNTDPSAGRRGQTSRVYDPKNGTLIDTSNPSFPVPSYGVGVEWRYRIRPSDPMAFSAQFDYDGLGRPTDVWKLQKFAPGFYYVQTHTTYGADGAPTWGQASQVVEDYGSGRINRTTETISYTSWGKPSRVRDAAGHEFETTFDGDGQVQKIRRMDTTTPQDIVTYSYGTTAGTVSYGQPISVTDGLSGVSQSISYTASGAGIGSPSSVTETNGADSYSVGYTYSAAGDRATATYATPNGTTRWGYADYVSLGDPASPSRVFQTLRRLDSSGNPTAEEFHYAYDSAGRLMNATFAQSPKLVSGSPYVPSAGGAYYDSTHPAGVRARASYVYDAGGRLTSLRHYWDTLNSAGTAYTSVQFAENDCGYEVTGKNRGLKTSNYLALQNIAATGVDSHTETYGYDNDLDYLTSANYGDGLPNATPTWSYDAAGNRNDASVADNLNRATTLNGLTCTNDILGNRLTKGNQIFQWDCLNRLIELDSSSSQDFALYTYRADGMRVSKDVNQGLPLTRYRYDGQMAVEDVETQGPATTITRYGLGARGIDVIERTVGSTVTTGFPIYDAHGNNVATLSRSGSGYTLSDRRNYDAWGVVRAQQSAGDPKLRYCANLGHKQDDESGLIYMSARYYEPTSGRFISEDPDREGSNFFSYCSNDPANRVDQNGKLDEDAAAEITRVIVRVINHTPAILAALGAAGSWLVGKIISATTKAALKAGAAALDSFADGLIQGGRQQLFSGAAELAYGESAGSLSLAAGFGMSGVKDMLGGAAQLSAGITLKYMAMLMKYIS